MLRLYSPKIAVTAIAVTFALPLALQAQARGNGNGNGCYESTRYMSRSCQSERREELNATIARCQTAGGRGDQRDCINEAWSDYWESGQACTSQRKARRETCQALGENRYVDPLISGSIEFVDPDEIGEAAGVENNPYVKLSSGHTHVLRAEEYDEDSGETSVELIVVHATDEVREIGNALCRVVVDVVLEPEWDEEEGKWEFEAIEVTDDWFAQDVDENVYYCGEVARNYEDGVLRDLDGSFESGIDLAHGGLLTLAAPGAGDIHRQEYALGEAEDIVQYLSADTSPAAEGVPAGGLPAQFDCDSPGNTCLMTYDFTPLEPGHAEYKFYLQGTGFVLAVPIEDGEVDENAQEWLLCSADEFDDILADGSDCGFDFFGENGADVREELAGALCDLHNELCDDGE